tara:strand:+ start:2647 stop:3408 length:762 start_codon:yes stop_codon:yes gene_type:complete
MLILRLLPLFLAAACAAPGSSLTEHRDARPLAVELEIGALSQGRNDVRIPGDTGTRFSMSDLIDDGSEMVGRVTVDWDMDERHAFRVVFAPLELDGTGQLSQTTTFAGQTFAAGTPTQGSYQFSSYRLGYRYTFLHDEHWRLRVGGTLFVRDAEIVLQQGATRASDSNVGVVPLANFAAEYAPSRRWRVIGEVDGLAASQGRAFDVSLKGHYDVSDACSIGLGWRGIEGGVDNDEVYNFAFLSAVVVSIGFRF